MTNYKERYRAMKKAMNWTNQDIADIMGSKLNSVEVLTSKSDAEFPRWGKLAVELYETMIANGRIVYDNTKPKKSEGGKE